MKKENPYIIDCNNCQTRYDGKSKRFLLFWGFIGQQYFLL